MKTIKEIETQIINLQKELNNLKNPPNYKRWRAEKGNYYYYINLNKYTSYVTDSKDDIDNGNYDFGNYYKTQEEAEQARDKQLAIIKINDRIDELNEGWEPNISISFDNYYIYYYYDKYFVSSNRIIQKDKMLKYIKTEEIAEQIISEMKDDLDLIFNIK